MSLARFCEQEKNERTIEWSFNEPNHAEEKDSHEARRTQAMMVWAKKNELVIPVASCKMFRSGQAIGRI